MPPMQVPFDPEPNSKNRFKRSLDDRSERPASDGAGKAFPTVKAVAILEAIATARRPLAISEFGVLLGIPKPTAHRIVHMLENEGLLQREPGSNRYVPGARLERLGLDIVAAPVARAAPCDPAIAFSTNRRDLQLRRDGRQPRRLSRPRRVGVAVRLAFRTGFACAVTLHIDGQVVSQPFAPVKARPDAAFDPALSLYRKHLYRHRSSGRGAGENSCRRSFPRQPGVSGRGGLRCGSRARPPEAAGRGPCHFRAAGAHVAATGNSAHSAAAGGCEAAGGDDR